MNKFASLLLAVLMLATMLTALGGCGEAAEPSSMTESETSGEASEISGETGDEPAESSGITDPQPAKLLGGTDSVDLAGRIVRLTPNNFLDHFHYRLESTDQGGEYDVLRYSVEMNASSDGIPCYSEGLNIDIPFDVEVRYAKEYTDSGILYDTGTFTCVVKGNSDALSGTIDLSEIPVFKRSETDTEHKKFTVLNVTPHTDNVAGMISYSTTNHTYKKAVSFDTAPGFDVVASGDCIAVYMAPENRDYLYDGLKMEILLQYTDDTSGRPDQYIRYNEERITMEGNLGGYGQYFHRPEGLKGDISKVVVSVINVGGYTIQSKGCTTFDYSGR